jgi:hypothetical protein
VIPTRCIVHHRRQPFATVTRSSWTEVRKVAPTGQ